MNDHLHDPELRALFEKQRHGDAARAPAFTEVMMRARQDAAADVRRTSPELPTYASGRRPRWRRPRWRREWVGGLAAAAGIAVLVVIPRMRSDEAAFEEAVRAFQSDPALGAWQSPTDGLLHLPGDRLLSTIPNVDMESH